MQINRSKVSQQRSLEPILFGQNKPNGKPTAWETIKKGLGNMVDNYIEDEYARPKREAKALVDRARRESLQILDQARKEAVLIKREAQEEAEKTRLEADQYADEVIEMADTYAQNILETTKNDRVRDNLKKILGQRSSADLFVNDPPVEKEKVR